MSILSNTSCANCGKPVEALYCSHCGERILTEKDRSIKVLLSELGEHLVNVDSKLFRTIASLVKRPGYLTIEYWNGKRIQSLRPLQLLITMNVFYFFSSYVAAHLSYFFSVMVPSLHDMLEERVFSPWVQGLVYSKLQTTHADINVYRQIFDSRLEDAAKSFVIILVPILAILLQVVFIRKRRDFMFHLIAASHIVSFYILLSCFYLLLGSISNRLFGQMQLNIFNLLRIAVLAVYILLFFRNAYDQKKFAATLSTLLFVFVGVQVIANLYDFILFCIVYVIS